MASLLGAEYHELKYSGRRVIRYLVLGLRVIALIARERPAVLYYQNPSLVLAAVVTLTRKLFFKRMKVVGDFHNAGVYPPWGQRLTRWAARNSDLVIVSNDMLGRVVRSWGATYMAMPDPLPDIDGPQPEASTAGESELALLFICSWAEDEPIAEVIEAARQVLTTGESVRIKITGRPKLEKYLPSGGLPENITLTGYLSASRFEEELRRADAIMDLTTRDNCMVCGAYEGVAVEKPLILSDNAATREYFDKGVVFTDNSAESIAACIRQLLQQGVELAEQVKVLKDEIYNKQRVAREELLAKLNDANRISPSVSADYV